MESRCRVVNVLNVPHAAGGRGGRGGTKVMFKVKVAGALNVLSLLGLSKPGGREDE